jgi:hypothetical protein
MGVEINSLGGGGGIGFSTAVYDLANFTANGTWTVGAFSNSNYVRFGFSGNARFCCVYVTGVYAGPGSSFMNITVPFTWAFRVRVAAIAFIAGVEESVAILLSEGTNLIRFERVNGAGWPAGQVLTAGQVIGFV